MNMQGGKMTKLLLVSAMTAGVLAGCGGEKTPAAEGAKNGEPQASKEPVELNVITAAAAADVAGMEKYFGDKIKTKFPNIKLNFIQKTDKDPIKVIQTLVTAGTPIDIYFDSIYIYMNTIEQFKLGYDMTPLMKKMNIDANAFDPGPLNITNSSYSNQVTGLPFNIGVPIIYYNKDIFDRFGVPYPKTDWTWDDLLSSARKLTLTDAGKTYNGFGLSFYHHFFHMNGLSAPYLDPKTGQAAFNTDPAWKKLIETAVVKPYEGTTYQDWLKESKRFPTFDDFLTGTNAIEFATVQGPGATLDKLETMNYGVAPVPVFPEKKTGPQPYPAYVGVTNISKHKEEAMQIVSYLLSEEHQSDLAKQIGVIPTLKNEAVRKQLFADMKMKNKDEYYKAIYTNPFAPLAPKTVYDETARLGLQDTKAMLDLATGKTDINSFLRNAEEKANQALERERKK